MTNLFGTAQNSTDWYEREAARHEAQKARAHEARVTPMHVRETAHERPREQQDRIDGGYSPRWDDAEIACVSAVRYRYGISVSGWATTEQLVEMRDALNAAIASHLGDEDEEL